ncbi:VWA domain-containing protein, partial [Candidatus Woesearchaeota archaeon]|nr:VWA domain-containing protein [Candidatus Woesearchaeota archaeon]
MESMRKIRKKAVFFTIDAFIASGILFVGLLIISSFHVNSQPTVHLSYLSEDITGVFSELKVSEINSPYVASLISDGNIVHLNNSVMEQIGEFWAENNNGLAQNFTEAVLGGIIPEKYGYSVLVDDEEILHNEGSLNNSLISSRKIASGYAKLKPVLGFTSKIFLTSIKNRKSSSVVYFGGFEGEGNITKKIFLPQNLTNIKEVYLEILPGTDFNLYINDNFAGSYPRGSGNSTFLIPGSWYVNQSYWNYFTAGENEVKISFEYINENFTAEGPKYIGGGYLKVVYITPDAEELDVTYYGENLAGKKYWFPGIEGFINTYSSTYIPGNLTSMKVYLNFVSNYITYLTIGGTTVYEAQGDGATEVTLTDSELSSIFSSDGVSYADLSMVTLPIRIGLKNITRTSAPLDSVLITDVSGSMRWRMDQDNVNGAQRECDNPNLNDNSTERLSIAKCAGKDFVDTILNNEGPLVGLVSYEDSTDSTLWLTDNKTELNNEIESYSASGSTCICCGINDAVD